MPFDKPNTTKFGYKLNAEISRSTNKERRWPIWVGSMDDLRRLAGAVDELGKIRRDKLVALIDERVDRELSEAKENNANEASDTGGSSSSAFSPLEFYMEQIEKSGNRERRNTERDYQVTVTAVDGDDTTKGNVESVLAEVDRRTVKSIEFSSGKYDDQISVLLAQTGYILSKRGVSLKVNSLDRGWAKHAFAQLTEEIDKGVPRYSWIHKRYGKVTVGLGSTLLAILTIVLIVLPTLSSKDRPIVWAAGAVVAVWTSIIMLTVDAPYYWLAPSFELIGQDTQSTGRRRIGTVAGLVSAVIIGIVVNRIYS